MTLPHSFMNVPQKILARVTSLISKRLLVVSRQQGHDHPVGQWCSSNALQTARIRETNEDILKYVLEAICKGCLTIISHGPVLRDQSMQSCPAILQGILPLCLSIKHRDYKWRLLVDQFWGWASELSRDLNIIICSSISYVISKWVLISSGLMSDNCVC